MCQPAKFYFYLTVYSVYSMTSLTMCESLLMEELKCGENLPAHTPDVVQLEPMLSPAYRKHVADEYIERKRQMSSEFFSVLVIGFQVCTIHTFIFHNFAVGRSFFCCCLGHACLAENILFNFSCFLRHVFPPRHLLSWLQINSLLHVMSHKVSTLVKPLSKKSNVRMNYLSLINVERSNAELPESVLTYANNSLSREDSLSGLFDESTLRWVDNVLHR